MLGLRLDLRVHRGEPVSHLLDLLADELRGRQYGPGGGLKEDGEVVHGGEQRLGFGDLLDGGKGVGIIGRRLFWGRLCR